MNTLCWTWHNALGMFKPRSDCIDKKVKKTLVSNEEVSNNFFFFFFLSNRDFFLIKKIICFLRVNGKCHKNFYVQHEQTQKSRKNINSYLNSQSKFRS